MTDQLDTNEINLDSNVIRLSSSEIKGDDSEEGVLKFFNYHEYLVKDYKPSSTGSPADSSPADSSRSNQSYLVINHFPNHYVSSELPLYKTTRIIRIARVYDSTSDLDFVPQFSTFVPGTEPAGLQEDEESTFEGRGIYDGNLFGQTSRTPLVPDLISAETFHEIITTLNTKLKEALDPTSMVNVVEGFLDILTIGFYSNIFCKYIHQNNSKRKLREVEDYIENINLSILKNTHVELISLRKSGFLSVSSTPYNHIE